MPALQVTELQDLSLRDVSSYWIFTDYTNVSKRYAGSTFYAVLFQISFNQYIVWSDTLCMRLPMWHSVPGCWYHILKTIPIELDEAARVDGASSFCIFWKIIVPLILPGIAAVAMFVLFNGWNEYMYSSVLVSKDSLKTLTVGIVALNSQYQIKWNDLMAASTISSLPLVVLFMCFQKYFIAGMTGGAVKS